MSKSPNQNYEKNGNSGLPIIKQVVKLRLNGASQMI